jgi:hypothetical protein
MNIDLRAVCSIYTNSGVLPAGLVTKLDAIGDSYGDRDIHEGSLFIERTVHGDYGGGLVYMSNMRVLKEKYPFLETYFGSYSFQQLYIPGDIEIDLAVYEKLNSLLDDIASLEDYCLADEEDWSELEMEMQNDATEEFLRRGYGKLGLLQEQHGEEKVSEAFFKILHNLNSDDELFHEEYNSVWLDDQKAIEMLIDVLGLDDEGDDDE